MYIYDYYRNSFCNYLHLGRDCANFVSQCLIKGGHEILKGSPCKSFSCGVQLSYVILLIAHIYYL